MQDGRKVIWFAWKGLEASSVAVPEDPTIGVAVRSYDLLAKLDSESNNKENNMPEPIESPVVDAVKIRAEAKQTLLARNKEIRAATEVLLKERPDRAEVIRKVEGEGYSGDEDLGTWQMRAMKEVFSAKPIEPEQTLEDLTNGDDKAVRDYSIRRGIACVVEGNYKNPVPTGLEGEVHAEIIKRMGGGLPEQNRTWLPDSVCARCPRKGGPR